MFKVKKKERKKKACDAEGFYFACSSRLLSLFLRNYNLSSEDLTLLKDPVLEIGLITCRQQIEK